MRTFLAAPKGVDHWGRRERDTRRWN
jgi:hypothetical protein